MTHKLREVVGRDLGRYEDGSQWFWCKLNSSHQNPTDYNIWSYSTQMPIMILNVSKWLKYISRYILSESWYLFYKCLDYSWCRQNTKKTEKKNFHRIGLHLLLNSWRYEGCPHDRPLPGESNNQYTRSQIINMLFLNSYSPAPQFQSLLMFAAVFSVAGCSLWDAGLGEIMDTANRNGSSN